MTNKQLHAILSGFFALTVILVAYAKIMQLEGAAPVSAPVQTLTVAKIESKPAPVVGGEEVEREICVTDAGASYSIAVILTARGASTRQWLSPEANNTATVPQPIIQGSPGRPQCATIKVRAGDTLKINGWANNTGLWHDYLAGNCPNPVTGALIDTNGTGKCSAVKITVDENMNGKSDTDAQPATFNSSPYNFDLYWTNVP